MKIVSLTVARNEQWVVGLSLRVALRWVDEAVVLLHNCSDRTEGIVREIAKDTNRVHVLTQTDPVWTEMAHRQRTLDAGREIGGTHFAIVDADEIPTGNVLGRLRGWTEGLEGGQLLDLPMIPCWKDLTAYRCDQIGMWRHSRITLAFKDMPGLCWKPKEDGYQYHNRPPLGSKVDPNLRAYPLTRQEQGGIFHLEYANYRRLIAKHALYKMDEVVRWPGREPNVAVDAKYSLAITERGLMVRPVPAEWWEGYDASQIRMVDEPWQEAEVKRLWKEHGPDKFKRMNLYGLVP